MNNFRFQQDPQYEAAMVHRGFFNETYFQDIGENLDLAWETYKSDTKEYVFNEIMDELNIIRMPTGYKYDDTDGIERVPKIDDPVVVDFINKLTK